MGRLDRVLDDIARASAPSERVRLLARSAVLLAHVGRLDEARRAVAQAERRMTSGSLSVLHPDVLYAKAAIRLSSGQPDEAVATLNGARDLARDCGRRELLPPCDALLAQCLVRCGQVERAIEHAERALQSVDPSDWDTQFNTWMALGRALMSDEQYEPALNAYRQARVAALELRDDVALADLLHGIVECQTSMLEADARHGVLDPQQAEAALVDNQSAARLGEQAAMLRSRARARLQRARLLLLLLRPHEAEAVLRDLLGQHVAQLDRGEANWARALLARCLAERGGAVQARALIELSLAGVDERPIEASLATHRVAAEVHLLLDDAESQRAAAATSQRVRERLRDDLERSGAALRRVLKSDPSDQTA